MPAAQIPFDVTILVAMVALGLDIGFLTFSGWEIWKGRPAKATRTLFLLGGVFLYVGFLLVAPLLGLPNIYL